MKCVIKCDVPRYITYIYVYVYNIQTVLKAAHISYLFYFMTIKFSSYAYVK